MALPDAPPIDWDNPIHGARATSLADAEKAMPFAVQVPKTLNEPVAIYTTDAGTPPEDAIIEFVYDTVPYGRVVVFERRPEVAAVDYSTAIEQTAADYSGSGVAAIHLIRGGTEALVESFDGNAGLGIYWLEEGLEFWVGGPSLTLDAILLIAESV